MKSEKQGIEEYAIPLLFAEEEREIYCEWGLKYNKLEMVQCIFCGIIVFLTWIGVFSLGFVFLNPIFLISSSMSFVNVPTMIAAIICIPVIGLSDFIYDRFHKRPRDYKHLEIILHVLTLDVKVMIRQYKNIIYEKEMKVEELLACVDPSENAIMVEENSYHIGENTRKYIYKDKSKLLKKPRIRTKMRFITSAAQLVKLLESVILGQEALRKQEEWEKMHGNFEE